MDNGNEFIKHLERKLDSIIIMLNCATSEKDKQFYYKIIIIFMKGMKKN